MKSSVGNAEPTPTSFAAWVPNDGEINEPLSNTQYPVGQEEINLAVGPSTAAANNNHEAIMIKSFKQNKHKFDIIVFGMQEAAFVNKQKKKELLDNISHPTTEDGLDDTTTCPRPSSDNNDKPSPGKTGKNHKRFNPLNAGAKQAAKAGMAVRGISANRTYKRKNK